MIEKSAENVLVEELLKDDKASSVKLKVVKGTEKGFNRKILSSVPARPGLALAGYFDFLHNRSIQILGKSEISFLNQLEGEKAKKDKLFPLFEHEIPCFIITWNQEPPSILIDLAKEKGVTVFSSSLPTSHLIILLSHYLEDRFAPEITLHASMLDVYGVGVLITGKSGVGKSECALELIARGHRLVADDIVEVKLMSDNTLVGTNAKLVKHHMEIRGLGIINIRDLYGTSSVCEQKQLELIAKLEEWDSNKEYDRLGIDDLATDILGVTIPQVIIPIRPGRTIATIVEVAATNHRLKQMGHHSAKDFTTNLHRLMARFDEEEEEIIRYQVSAVR